MIVTGASAGPSAMSGSATGLVTADAPCATALAISRKGESSLSARSPLAERAAVTMRRAMINGSLLVSDENSRSDAIDQLFNSGLIFFSKSSNEVSPLIFSPLTKKVGVELTFSTSLAYFWSAAILSSSA